MTVAIEGLCAACGAGELLVDLGDPDGAHVRVCPSCARAIEKHLAITFERPAVVAFLHKSNLGTKRAAFDAIEQITRGQHRRNVL